MNLDINPNVVQTKALDASFSGLTEEGHFKGYGSVFNVKDDGHDIVVPGAFTESIEEMARKNRVPPILWQHQTGNPIGDWKSLIEDPHGLAGHGGLWLKEAPQAVIAYKGLQTKAITGLSIGYYVLDADLDTKRNARLLTKLGLVEISIVTSPMNDDARAEAVKAKIARGEEPTMAEVEKYLRDAGFSKSRATAIVSHGMKNARSDSDGTTAAILTALRGFNL